jgi:hypothetical protein
MKTKRAKACDITQAVKDRVWERDKHCCILCDCNRAKPNAHFISRAHGGLGIEQNVITLCTYAGNNCHHIYDNGTEEQRSAMRGRIRQYLKDHYPDWDESKLIYRKWG